MRFYYESVGLVLAKIKNSSAPDSLENVISVPSDSFNVKASKSIVVYAELTHKKDEAAFSLNPVTYGMLPYKGCGLLVMWNGMSLANNL